MLYFIGINMIERGVLSVVAGTAISESINR